MQGSFSFHRVVLTDVHANPPSLNASPLLSYVIHIASTTASCLLLREDGCALSTFVFFFFFFLFFIFWLAVTYEFAYI